MRTLSQQRHLAERKKIAQAAERKKIAQNAKDTSPIKSIN